MHDPDLYAAGAGRGHEPDRTGEAVSAPVVAPALAALHRALEHFDDAEDRIGVETAGREAVTAARHLLAALGLRTYLPQSGTDDRGEQVVVTVYGVDLSIRRRDDGVFVHVDSCDMPEELLPLIGEFNCAGESVYAEREQR